MSSLSLFGDCDIDRVSMLFLRLCMCPMLCEHHRISWGLQAQGFKHWCGAVISLTMALGKILSFAALAYRFDVAVCMEPLAALAVQPVWQAGEPIAVNIDYDVPAFGPQDAALQLPSLSNVDRGMAAVQNNIVHKQDRLSLSNPDERVSASFLSTRVLPVDADKIKKSLYLTQSLRSPPQASVNIIMREDVRHMKDVSKYRVMVDQTHDLQNEFRKGLADLRDGHQ